MRRRTGEGEGNTESLVIRLRRSDWFGWGRGPVSGGRRLSFSLAAVLSCRATRALDDGGSERGSVDLKWLLRIGRLTGRIRGKITITIRLSPHRAYR